MKTKMYQKLQRFLGGALAAVMMVTSIPVSAAEAVQVQEAQEEKTLKLWYDEPARITGIDQSSGKTDTGFEEEALPLGCGYMGANVWGGTDTDVIYVTENSLANPYSSNSTNSTTSNRTGLNLFAKTWIDFGHTQANVKNYYRDLVLDDATAHVSYDYNGVTYTREYFTSYPDKVMVIRLDASEKGALDFTLRPEAPYLKEYFEKPGDDMAKTGKVTAAEDGTITMAGTMSYYQINYEGQYKVIPQGGTMTVSNDENGDHGQIRVEGADSALILMAVGTNYEMTPETFLAPQKEKLDPDSYPHEKVTAYLNDAAAKTYEELRERHVEDYQTYYSRVNLDLGGKESGKTTDVLLSDYKKGSYDKYLEEVFFQYGRYLLIASSRKGCLPANLQGIWNAYDNTPWSGGYWHNINVQMNYWPAFVTNMPEMFESYADFNEAFRRQAEGNADSYPEKANSPLKAPDGTGENGWAIGTGVYPYTAGAPAPGGHSGPGTGAFTSMLFWDWYDFTRDASVLENHTYPAVAGMAKFLSKSLIEKDGLLLISPSASPENANNKQTVGCAFDQQMTWENHTDLLKTAELLGKEDDAIVQTAQEQIDKLDPVNIGYSGQVKEYREENYYGEFGETEHRHISQLVGLYPGTSINQNTRAWMDAAKITLNKRGLGSTGWSIAHRLCTWARVGDGEVSYKELQKLLKEKIMKNLWDTHPPFQIDGNFGATAGVGEMLLQSHAGYVAPLAALPNAWKDGSYEGLLARGNFVVDASWTDGKATEFEITSQSGGSCSVKYPGLAEAAVTDGAGNAVSVSADGTDLITFATVRGETYRITEIPAVKETAAPSALSVKNTDAGMKLQWKESADAVSYRVYEAVNDAADYTLVADQVKSAEWIYTKEAIADKMHAEDRVTMCVTAVGADGRESERITAQILPITAPQEASGIYVSDTNVQVTISTVAGADGYVVYEKDGESWKKLYETAYTTVYIKDASADKVYAVAAIGQGRESEKTEITITEQAVLDNILLNKPVKLTSGQSIHASYPITKLVNGKADPTDSTDRIGVNGDKAGFWTMEADLQGTYFLDTLSIVEWKNGEGKTRSKKTKVEALTPSGEWQTVAENFALVWNGTKEVDMKGIEASKLRFTFDNQSDPPKYASITEIMCSALLPEQADKTDLFNALQSMNGIDGNGYALTAEVVNLQVAQKDALPLLSDLSASQEAVDAAAEKLAAAVEAYKNADLSENILLHQKIETSAPAQNSTYPVEAMVDGDSNTRYAGSDTARDLTATVTLDKVYLIDSVIVQEFLEANGGNKTRGGETSIEILSDGEWVKAVDKVSLKSERDHASGAQATNEFKLETPVEGSAIRFSFYNTLSSKRITVFELQATGKEPEPETEKTEFDIKVNGKVVQTGAYNTKVTITAPEAPEGKEFTGWKLNGTVVSKAPSYTFYIAGDMDFEACYDEVEEAPAAMLAGTQVTKQADGRSDLKFVAQLAVPEGYKVLDAGLLWLTNDNETAWGTAEGIADGVKVTHITKMNTSGQFSVTIKGVPAGRFVRGVIYAKVTNGTETFVYSQEQKVMAK